MIDQYSTTKILDHGYMKLIETWGSDERIVEAARMSTGRGFVSWDSYQRCRRCDEVKDAHDGWAPNSCLSAQGAPHDWADFPRGDLGLLSYLMNNRHETPFEMAGMIIEVQAPIMVFREWHRHRTQWYNEMSARYAPLPAVDYMPTVERCLMVNGSNKQAGAVAGSDVLTHESALEWLEELAGAYEHSERVYQSGLRRGIPKELARLPVTVGRYSRMRAGTNLRNWLAFLTLRSDSVLSGAAAQWEIRQFANEVAALVKNHFPRTYDLFVERSLKQGK